MNDKMSKASICSIVSLDIIDYSVKSEAEKLALITQFDSIIKQAVADIPVEDRVIVEAVNGLAISCTGPLEDALEDALFISLTVRDEILKNNLQSTTPLYVQIGINIGSALAIKEANGKQNLIGDGLEDAQRVMCFANPNQILVTYEYYEKASQLTQEISQMFDKYDMHTLEQDVYAVRLLKEPSFDDEPTIPADIADLKPSVASKLNWKYIGSVMFGLMVFYLITKVGLEPNEPNIILDEPAVAVAPSVPKSEPAEDAAQNTVQVTPSANEDIKNEDITLNQKAPTEIAGNAPSEPTQHAQAKSPTDDKKVTDDTLAAEASQKELVSNKKVKAKAKLAQKTEAQSKQASNESEKMQASNDTNPIEAPSKHKATSNSKENEAKVVAASKQTDAKTEKTPAKEKSAWESFKAGIAKGAERNCTQGEIALNQCLKI